MQFSFNSQIVKRVIFIGVNYQLIINILLILITVLSANILNEPLIMNIEKYSLGAILWSLTFPPLIEELLFRKALTHQLQKKYSIPTSAILSSLLFALCHGNILLALFAFGVGMVSCQIYNKTKDINYSILFHSISNLTGILFHNFITLQVCNGTINLLILQNVLMVLLILSIGVYIKMSSVLLKTL